MRPDIHKNVGQITGRKHVGSHIGDPHLVPLIWSGPDPEQIPFDDLPQKCVAKTNHGSGRNIILKKPTDRASVTSQLKERLSENFYWNCREAQYYEISSQVLIEEFLGDGQDYRRHPWVCQTIEKSPHWLGV